MKHRIIKALIYTSAILAFGCSKKLDTVPTASINAADALKTGDDVKVALVGAYKDFGATNFYGGLIFVEADLLANTNEMNWSGTFQGLTQISNKAIPVDNGFVSSAWLAGYKAINDANNVLANLSVLNSKDL